MTKQMRLFLVIVGIAVLQVSFIFAPPVGALSAPVTNPITAPITHPVVEPVNNPAPINLPKNNAPLAVSSPQLPAHQELPHLNQILDAGHKSASKETISHEPEKHETAAEINKEAADLVVNENEKVLHHNTVMSGIDFEDKEDEGSGVVDTTDSTSGGNWLLKRVWGEKTEEVFSQIKDAVKKIMEMRLTFFAQRNDIDKKFDQFYQQLGFDQGPFEDILNFSLEIYEKVKKDGLNVKEKAFYEVIQAKKATLEQLKKDVEAITVLDQKINDALDVLMNQIDLSNKYEDQAWENFRDILRELNDKEARKQYYETKGILDDVKKIAEYLTGPFSSYFSQSLQSAQEHMKSIVSQMQQLKTDGIDLKKEADLLEKEDEASLQMAHEKEALQKENKQKQVEAQHKAAQKEAGVLGMVTSWLHGAADFFVTAYHGTVDGLMSLFGGKNKSSSSKNISVKQSTNLVTKQPTHQGSNVSKK